ncbi:MAG: penicillin acylase family protein, partial [Myxococcota bacterium]
PTAPSLLYEIHLRSPSLDVAGVTIPGLPVFWAGRNLNLAWAAIPVGAVTVDLFQETVRESDGTYHDGERWVKLEESRESIRVATATGWREESWPVRATRHGPLLDGLVAEASSSTTGAPEATESRSRAALSLAWTGMRPGNGIASLLGVARAREASELVDALESHHEPVLAVVYADQKGAAGMQMAGWLPRRTLPSSLVPVPGRMRIYDWRGPIPFPELPIVRLDPSAQGPGLSERAWVAVADGSLAQGLSRAEIEWSWQPGVRLRRLERLLAELTSGDPDGPPGSPNARRLGLRKAVDLARDVRDMEAAEVVPALMRLAQQGPPLRPEAEEIVQILSLWDGNLSISSQGATAYAVLIQAIFEALFRPVLGDALLQRYLELPGVRPQSLVARVLVVADRRMEPGGWTDRARITQAVHDALRKTWVVLSHRLGPDREGWEWGRLHGLAFQPFSPEAADSDGLEVVGTAGGDATLAATGFGVSKDFRTQRASLYRMAVDLSAPDRMLTVLAPGQSEFPRSPHFDDGIERWREGRPGLLLTSRLLVEDEVGSKLLLEPSQ